MQHRNTRLFICILFIITLILGLNYYFQPIYKRLTAQLQDQANQAVAPSPSPTENPKKILFDQLSSREKVAQLLAVPVVIDEESDQQKINDWLKENMPGFMTIFGEQIKYQTAKSKIEELKAQYKAEHLMPLFMVDHEGGLVQRLSGEGFTLLPPWQDYCQSFQDEQSANQTDLLQQSAQELNEIGINLVLAPVVDLANQHPVLGSRVCAEDDLAKKSAEKYIFTFGQYQIMSVIKHFPGIGNTKVDLHTDYQEIDLSPEDTLIFNDLLNEFPNIGVMISHVGIKEKLAGQPCSLSQECLQAFPSSYPNVLLITDALEMASARETESAELKSLSEVAKAAILAGNHVLLFGPSVTIAELDTVLSDLVNEYENNQEFGIQVDQAVQKILQLKKL